MGMAVMQLVVDASGDIGQGEGAVFASELGVDEDLEQQVAEFFFEVDIGRQQFVVRRGLNSVDGLQDFVGFLQQVRPQRAVGLFTIPRAVLAQAMHEHFEALKRSTDRFGEFRNPQGRQMVGRKGLSQLGPLHFDDDLIAGSEPLQDGDRPRVEIVEDKNHVFEHGGRVHLGDQQRTTT